MPRSGKWPRDAGRHRQSGKGYRRYFQKGSAADLTLSILHVSLAPLRPSFRSLRPTKTIVEGSSCEVLMPSLKNAEI